MSLTLLGVTGCMPDAFLITPVRDARPLVEFEVDRDSIWAADKIAIIDVSGVISGEPVAPLIGEAGDNPVVVFTEKLKHAAHDKHVKAVVLRLDSPGGGVTASDLMYTELLRFKQQTGKPVIACMLDVAASGAYYLACGADRIYAHPTTVTGSIGVIMITPDVSGTMAKIGVRANIIKSGPMKDAGSPFREMNDADRAEFQGMIDTMYERFLDVVSRGRPGIDKDHLRELADGSVYLGPQAKAEGLVDEVGTIHDAIAAARDAAGLSEKKIVVVEYARRYENRPNVYAQSSGEAPRVNLVNIELPRWLTGPSPRFMYMWAPQW